MQNRQLTTDDREVTPAGRTLSGVGDRLFLDTSAFIRIHPRFLVQFLLPFVLSGSLWRSEMAVASGAAEPGRLFREGERLVYDVTWLGLKAGQASLEARGVVSLTGQRAYHLVTTAQSAPLLSKLYRVDDRSESYLALEPMHALRFEKHLREGRYRHSSQTEFDHEARLATFRYLDFSQVPKEISRLEEAERYGKYVHQEFPLAPGALDELSVLYYVRSLPLSPGTPLLAKVFASKKNWDLEIKLLGRETLETVLGRRETLVVEPLLKFEGIFQRRGRMIIWMTDDAEKIPVLMKSEVKIGSFMATLTRREIGLPQAGLGFPGTQTR